MNKSGKTGFQTGQRGYLEIPDPVCFQFKILTQLVSCDTQHVSAKGILGGCICSIDVKATGHAHTTAVSNRHGILCQVTIDCLACLLYTSDAADDLTRVDLGGRRIIKKKKK